MGDEREPELIEGDKGVVGRVSFCASGSESTIEI